MSVVEVTSSPYLQYAISNKGVFQETSANFWNSYFTEHLRKTAPATGKEIQKHYVPN